jgi:hypothetical protein
MGFAKHGADVLMGEQIENVVGHEAIVRFREFTNWRPTLGKENLRPWRVGSEAGLGQAHHLGADIHATVARCGGEKFLEQAQSEAPGPASELEEILGAPKLSMMYD